jgi:hypothetical protein
MLPKRSVSVDRIVNFDLTVVLFSLEAKKNMAGMWLPPSNTELNHV